MQEAIKNLGQATPKAGSLGILHVLISYPAGFHQDAFTRNVGKTCDPIATVDLANLVELLLGSGTQQALGLRLEAAAEERKRKHKDTLPIRCTKPCLA